MKHFVIALCFAFYCNTGFSTDKYNCQLYQAYIEQDMPLWKQTIQKLKQHYEKTKDKEDLFDVVFAQYGYVGYLIGEKEAYDEAEDIIKTAEDNLDMLINYRVCPSRSESIKAAFYAYEIAMNPGKSFYLGPKTLKLIEKAIEINPKCPYGWIEKGNAYYHMPKVLGGSYSKAADYYSKAIMLFEETPKKTKCNWYYMNTLIWLAKSYEQNKEKGKARLVYQKILQIDPDYDYARKWMNKL